MPVGAKRQRSIWQGGYFCISHTLAFCISHMPVFFQIHSLTSSHMSQHKCGHTHTHTPPPHTHAHTHTHTHAHTHPPKTSCLPLHHFHCIYSLCLSCMSDSANTSL